MTASEFIMALPQKVPAAALEGKNTLFHFELKGDDAGSYTIRVADGQMTVEEGLHGDPKCKVSAKAENFMNVVTGRMNPTMAIMMGKIKVSNLSEMMEYARIFGVSS